MSQNGYADLVEFDEMLKIKLQSYPIFILFQLIAKPGNKTAAPSWPTHLVTYYGHFHTRSQIIKQLSFSPQWKITIIND